jgi:hypothetical protein
MEVLRWLLYMLGCAFIGLSAPAADFGLRTVQNEALSEAGQQLVGHWRMTKIVFERPKDEHLVLEADGSVSLAGRTRYPLPFTFYEGQLVYPNIPNRRGFWERIE